MAAGVNKIPFEDLVQAIEQELKFGDSSRKAAENVFADYHPRIFEEGLKSDGSQIGSYKSESYKKLRVKKGRQIEYINLEFTGQFQKDLKPTGEGQVGYGFRFQKNLELSNYLEERYGIIFDLTDGEMNKFVDTFTKLIGL